MTEMNSTVTIDGPPNRPINNKVETKHKPRRIQNSILLILRGDSTSDPKVPNVTPDDCKKAFTCNGRYNSAQLIVKYHY
jgi:hypothetical protein